MNEKRRIKYNALLMRREQLVNFIYIAELPLVSNEFGELCSIKEFLMIDAATDLAYKTIIEIDTEIEKLLNNG